MFLRTCLSPFTQAFDPRNHAKILLIEKSPFTLVKNISIKLAVQMKYLKYYYTLLIFVSDAVTAWEAKEKELKSLKQCMYV